MNDGSNILRHTDLWIDNVWIVTPEFDPATFADVMQRAYCSGLLAGMRGDFNALRWEGARMRAEHPQMECVDVRVRFDGKVREFTWDEFEAWLK